MVAEKWTHLRSTVEDGNNLSLQEYNRQDFPSLSDIIELSFCSDRCFVMQTENIFYKFFKLHLNIVY